FFLIVFGFFPLTMLGLHAVGGWSGLTARLADVSAQRGLPAGAYTHAWAYMGSAAHNPIGVEWFGLAMGLGFVLSFGYWCTDFLVVQRAMAAESMDAARRTPLFAAFPKMLFPFLVIVPGMIAIALTGPGGHGIIPPKLDVLSGVPLLDAAGHPVLDYDLATPMMLVHFFPNGLLGLGITALMASFMSGMAGNVSAFNTVWTYDLYQTYVHPNASDRHYLWVGRVTTVVGIVLSVGAAYVAASFNNIMDLLQLIFAFANAPLFATFLLGMFWKRSTGHGAFTGLLGGMIAAAIHHGMTLPLGAHAGVKGGFLGVWHVYPSELAQTFWTAIVAWVACFAVTIVASLMTRPRPVDELRGLVSSLTPRVEEGHLPWYARPRVLAVVVLSLVLALNLVFF
ncbi:MAG TPA: hypothetical protein VG818_13005, partial [Gemmatimonadaceae bacterium]|nr:hypothetical protein [Gemmatimonadaceae bacterium]